MSKRIIILNNFEKRNQIIEKRRDKWEFTVYIKFELVLWKLTEIKDRLNWLKKLRDSKKEAGFDWEQIETENDDWKRKEKNYW